MAYVPVVFILAGMAAYTVLAGADFGAGLWTLLAFGPDAQHVRDQARHAMGPVWEANHVWLIFVLVVCWTAYPVAFGSITSTLAAPLLIAAIGIIFRGAAYALRGQGASRAAENLFAVSSVLTPFALGTAVGAIAIGRVPVGNAAGNLVTSWLNPASVLVGALAVVFSGYLAAVYLAADSLRYAEREVAAAFRRRALAAGLVSGALALAGLLVMRHSGLDLTRGAALAMVCLSGVAGLATLTLCWRSRFEAARLTAALAVAAVVVGWAVAQTPRLLPGMTVTQAAAGRSTLVSLIIAVACGSVILIPSLALLFTLFLRGRLDTPEHHAPGAVEAFPAGAPVPAETPASAGTPAPTETISSPETTASSVDDGTFPAGTATPTETPAPPETAAFAETGASPGEAVHPGATLSSRAEAAAHAPSPSGEPETQSRDHPHADAVDRAIDDAGEWAAEGPELSSPRSRAWSAASVVGLAAGTGLLVFGAAAWTRVLGVAGLVLCAVSVFLLAATPSPQR
jgi:cytochrome d ubiquinol oxidase subunit II